MKVKIIATEFSGSTELEYFLRDIRKLRNTIYTGSTEKFIIEIKSKMKV